MSLPAERFYEDAYALLSPWEQLLLRVELVLTWKYPALSAICTLFINASFWFVFCVKNLCHRWSLCFSISKVFIITSCISLVVVIDLGRNWFWPKCEGVHIILLFHRHRRIQVLHGVQFKRGGSRCAYGKRNLANS